MYSSGSRKTTWELTAMVRRRGNKGGKKRGGIQVELSIFVYSMWVWGKESPGFLLGFGPSTQESFVITL